ncbi:hypothetical protein [Nonomuraea sp. NPDC003804]|uniref:hypothetical protein n=1 Tax=Nonomuraea sp. NPDC003804 TaxID=3154547 RepID=UPI0033A7AEE2
MKRPRPVSVITLKTSGPSSAKSHPYPRRTPVLALDFDAISVLVTTSCSNKVTPADVTFARELAKEAAAFAAAVERMFRSLPTPMETPK